MFFWLVTKSSDSPALDPLLSYVLYYRCFALVASANTEQAICFIRVYHFSISFSRLSFISGSSIRTETSFSYLLFIVFINFILKTLL